MLEVYKVLDIIILGEAEQSDTKANNDVLYNELMPPKVYTFVKNYFETKISREQMASLSLVSLAMSLAPSLASSSLSSPQLTLSTSFKSLNNSSTSKASSTSLAQTNLAKKRRLSSRSGLSISPSPNNGIVFGCVLLHFGIALFKSAKMEYPKFENFAKLKSANGECPTVQYERRDYQCGKVPFRSAPIEQQLFNEAISNYTRTIRIVSNKCQAEAANYDKEIANGDKESLLNGLIRGLNGLIDDYDCPHLCPTDGHILQKFVPILFGTLRKWHQQKVTYAKHSQTMALARSVGEHLLARLDALITRKWSALGQIGQESDFVRTLENLAAPVENTLEFAERRKSISAQINAQLFKLLFSLAFYITIQMQKSDLSMRYLKSFAFAYQSIGLPSENFIDER
ncbi:hypothetical protein niasHT_036729 [Heterodera trifolii]|uniref:Uncharacterized protein n=1 Tax=Heterodera trifolii TaxID=157864 RepID=A0ABD2IY61_9BILA